MKRNLVIAVLGIFVCSSIFLLSSCAKKQVVTEEKEIKAAPKEVAKVEKKEPAVKKEKEIERADRVRIERLKELELAKKREAGLIMEEEAWQERRATKFEAEAIYFDFDKSFIRLEYRSALKEKAEYMKDNPNVNTRIEGNCDERGTSEYNLALGERRADSAKSFLISLGISPDKIETISYGEERPLALGHGEGAWAQNRRDDFVIIKK